MGKAEVGQKVILKMDDYPFQEFGTRRGITPMMAVYTAYNTVLADMRAALGAR